MFAQLKKRDYYLEKKEREKNERELKYLEKLLALFNKLKRIPKEEDLI